MPAELEAWMGMAIEEARESLREGQGGFGAVILRDGEVLARSHDRAGSVQEPAVHAEMRAVRAASLVAGDLSGCLLLCTHEPCPACAAAIAGAGISRILYGYGIADPGAGGPEERSEARLLPQECAALYDPVVRAEVDRLRGASDRQLREYGRRRAGSRLEWYRREKHILDLGTGDAAERGYRLLLAKLGLSESEAPVVQRAKGRVVFHSRNFCPTLEACNILGLDTRRVCRLYNEEATDRLIRRLDPGLRFRRNYEKIRPHCEYCEESIELRVQENSGILHS